MASQNFQVLQAAQFGFADQDAEIAAARIRQLLIVEADTTTGSGDINSAFLRDRRFRLVFVRCHFVGGTGTSPLTISVDSGAGSAYDVRLFTIAQAGTNQDVNFRITSDELTEPSPWTFQEGSSVRIAWTNPDSPNMTWGLEIGLALAT